MFGEDAVRSLENEFCGQESEMIDAIKNGSLEDWRYPNSIEKFTAESSPEEILCAAGGDAFRKISRELYDALESHFN